MKYLKTGYFSHNPSGWTIFFMFYLLKKRIQRYFL
nr:hypothetical protein MarFTME_038 [Marseillevirus futianmevirus]